MGEDHGERGTDGGSKQRRYRRGLHASVRSNASAYGFSVTITASFGLLVSALGTPTAHDIFAFAGGAVAAFALIEFVASRGYRRGLKDEPPNIEAIGPPLAHSRDAETNARGLMFRRELPGR